MMAYLEWALPRVRLCQPHDVVTRSRRDGPDNEVTGDVVRTRGCEMGKIGDPCCAARHEHPYFSYASSRMAGTARPSPERGGVPAARTVRAGPAALRAILTALRKSPPRLLEAPGRCGHHAPPRGSRQAIRAAAVDSAHVQGRADQYDRESRCPAHGVAGERAGDIRRQGRPRRGRADAGPDAAVL